MCRVVLYTVLNTWSPHEYEVGGPKLGNYLFGRVLITVFVCTVALCYIQGTRHLYYSQPQDDAKFTYIIMCPFFVIGDRPSHFVLPRYDDPCAVFNYSDRVPGGGDGCHALKLYIRKSRKILVVC